VTDSFTTGATYDITAATAINSDPANYTTAGINVTPKIVFNKPLNPITVNTSTFNMFLSDTGQYIPATVTQSANGTEVTITPQIPLLPNTEYHFRGCCGFQDQDGNNGNQIDLYFWTNGGKVTTGPTVTVSPLNGVTGIPLNAQVLVSVSTPIDPTTWSQNSIQLLNGATPVAGTVSLPNVQTLIFTPTSALTAGTTYTVKVNGFTDANGNAVVPSTTTFTTGSIAATGGLTLTSQSIPNGANVTNNLSPITLTFSQTLDPATVNLGTFLVTNSQNTNWGLAGAYSVNGNAVTFTPSNPYPPNATIWVYVTSGLTDVAGDAYSGSTWPLNFTTTGDTADSTPLTVLSVSPASGATNVRPDTPVSVTFNKGINPYSANGSSNSGRNALLFAGQGVQDTGGNITMSADNRTMTLNSGSLYTGTTYTIELPAGGISDPSGNTITTSGSTSKPFISTFTTGGNPATGNGGVQSEAPGNGATGVPTDTLLTLYMNRQVNASTLPGQLTVTVNGQVYAGNVQATASNYEIQFTPTVAFPSGAAVQWFLSGSVLDVNGDAFSGNSGYFYTAPVPNPAAAPVNLNNSPGYGVSNVPTNADIYLQYSLPLNNATLTSSNVYLYNNSNGTYPAVTITQPEPGVIELAPNSPLTPIGSYNYYACANGNVQGTNGVGISGSCWETYFNVAGGPDTTPGTVKIGPPNGSINVGTNVYIRMIFSKPINRAMFSSANIQITTGGNPIPGTWSFSYVSGTNDSTGAYFSPVNPLPPSSPISVSVSGVLDYAGNTFTTATSNFTTAALPDYTTPTATLDFPYGQGGIATNASFTCHYSEPMDPSSVNPSNTYIYSYVAGGNNYGTDPWTYTWSTDLTSVTMTPTTPLFANSQYYYYCGGAIDLTGNGMNATDAVFYTGNGPSSQGPTLLYANPPNGMTNVPLNNIGGPWTSILGLLFNEPVNAESLGNITLTPTGGSSLPIGVVAEWGNTIAVVDLPWALSPNTTYTFNVAGVTDISGNAASGTTTSSFTTGSTFDWIQPTVVSTVPANGVTTTGVPASVSMTMSEALDPVLITSSQFYLRYTNTQVTVPTTISISSSANPTIPTTVTLTPVSPLAESTIYDIVYWPNNWWPTDIAGNNLSNYGVEATFTTGTATAVNGACGTANGKSFSAPPTANLCSAGTASAITNPGSWTWSCNGEYSGTNASCSATVTGTPACSAQLSSLQGLWPGNDNPNDYSPNGYNGTLENGVTYALGEVGDAFSFNGSNQYVLIGEPVPTNLQIQNDFTMSAWIYVTSYPANVGSGPWQYIFGSEGPNNGLGLFLAGPVSGSYPGVPPGGIDLDIGKGSTTYSVITTTQIPLNQWVLVTATATANNPAQIYYNGVLQSAMTPSGETVWNGTVGYTGTAFAIGQYLSGNYAFTGLINDAQIYNAALTQAQVQAIYNAGSGGVCK
jgi:hypothetical protein